jgi:hypothetical protein
MEKRHIIDAISIFGCLSILTATVLFTFVNPNTKTPLYAGSALSLIASVSIAVLGVASLPIIAYLMHLWKIPFYERKIKSIYESDVPFSDFNLVLDWFSQALKSDYTYTRKVENIGYDMSLSWRKISDIKLKVMAIVHVNVLTESDWDEIKQILNENIRQLQGDFITECPNVRVIIILCADMESENFMQALYDVKQTIWKNHYLIGVSLDTKKLRMVCEYADWGEGWRESVRRRLIKKLKLNGSEKTQWK